MGSGDRERVRAKRQFLRRLAERFRGRLQPDHRATLIRGGAILGALMAASVWAAGSGYHEQRAAAVARCAAIDPSSYQTGMIFNSDGHRSVFHRSACFQEAAVLYRDPSLCAQVKERKSFFFSSWGYSGKRCGELVAQGMAADRNVLEDMKGRYLRGAVTLRDFRVERNGNGRDFDIIPSFNPGDPHPYSLRFDILGGETAGSGVLLHASGFHLNGRNKIRIYVRQADIRQRLPGFELGRPYRVRATLTFSVGNGSQAGRWSDAFIEQVFPAAERSASLVKEIVF